MGVNASVGVHVALIPLRRVVNDHLRRHARAIELNQIRRLAALPAEISETVLETNFDAVRTGHVGRGGHDGLANGLAVVDTAVVLIEGGLENRVALGDDQWIGRRTTGLLELWHGRRIERRE